MSYTSIKIENLSKIYRIGKRDGYQTFREVIVAETKKIFRKLAGMNSKNEVRTLKSDTIWALQGVSFEVQDGEVIGIIGRNGAGKSTLLKILSKITEPSKGKIELRGRVGSLLEVGTGFHPELTGHENIYLYGAILGMDRWEVTRKFDEIVAFAEIDKFIDTPVKRYSSGMYMRLAFAVAAHLETEILLVDEVLAVGDISFQKKCLGKMSDVSNKGRTVLFVSHNMGAVKNLCEKAVWLETGKIMKYGKADEVVGEYENSGVKTKDSVWYNKSDEEKKEIAYIEKIEIADQNYEARSEFLSSENIKIVFTIFIKKPDANLKLGFDLVKNSEIVFRSQQVDSPNRIETLSKGRNSLVCVIPKDLLNIGEYQIIPQISVHLIKGLTKRHVPVLKFKIKFNSKRSAFHFVLNERNHPGTVFPLLNWNLK